MHKTLSVAFTRSTV